MGFWAPAPQCGPPVAREPHCTGLGRRRALQAPACELGATPAPQPQCSQLPAAPRGWSPQVTTCQSTLAQAGAAWPGSESEPFPAWPLHGAPASPALPLRECPHPPYPPPQRAAVIPPTSTPQLHQRRNGPGSGPRPSWRGAWRRARTHGCLLPRSERPLLLQPLWGPRLLPGQQRVPQLHL